MWHKLPGLVRVAITLLPLVAVSMMLHDIPAFVISLMGCTIIVRYGAFRLDQVLILGQSVGFFTYSRNIILYRKSHQA